MIHNWSQAERFMLSYFKLSDPKNFCSQLKWHQPHTMASSNNNLFRISVPYGVLWWCDMVVILKRPCRSLYKKSILESLTKKKEICAWSLLIIIFFHYHCPFCQTFPDISAAISDLQPYLSLSITNKHFRNKSS